MASSVEKHIRTIYYRDAGQFGNDYLTVLEDGESLTTAVSDIQTKGATVTRVTRRRVVTTTHDEEDLTKFVVPDDPS